MRRDHSLFLVIAALVLGCDQASKLAVSSLLARHQTKSVIDGILNITLVHNTGAAFGLFAGQTSALRTVLFLAVAAVALGVVAWLLVKLRPEQQLEMVALALIAGGAMGNGIDRLRLGEVIDFIDLHYGPYHWPAFNLADAAISTGVGLLLLSLVLERRRGQERQGSA